MRLSIYIPEKTHREMQRLKEKPNWSAIFLEAYKQWKQDGAKTQSRREKKSTQIVRQIKRILGVKK